MQATESQTESSSHTSFRLGSYQGGQYSYSSISYGESGEESSSREEVGTRNSQEQLGSASTISNTTYTEDWASIAQSS